MLEGLRGLHVTCEGSMGHVARAPWDMLRGLHGMCCEGSMGHVARAPWEMLRGLYIIVSYQDQGIYQLEKPEGF